MDLVAVLGAVGTLAVTVAGALGVWWFRILDKRHKHELAMQEADRKAKKEEAASKRQDKKDVIEDFEKLLKAQEQQIKENRDEVHELVNRVTVAENKEHACQIRLTRVETQLEEQRLKTDDAILYIEDLEAALTRANVPIVRRRRSTGSAERRALPQAGSDDAISE